MRSSRHHVAGRRRGPRACRLAPARRRPRPPPACPPSARRRSWRVRPTRRRGNAAPGAWPPWRTRTRRPPSSRPPGPLGTGRSPRRTPAASRLQPPSGDHSSPAVPALPVGSMRQTRPRPARVACVSRSRSVFTLAARTGPGQPRMAGTASDVVLPLWVGPITTSDWPGSAATPAPGRTPPGKTPRRRRPAGTRSARTPQRAEVAPPGPAGAAAGGTRVGGPATQRADVAVARCPPTARRRPPPAGPRR